MKKATYVLCLCTLLLVSYSCKQKEKEPVPKSNADPKLSVYLTSHRYFPSINIRTKEYIDTAHNTVWGHVAMCDPKDEGLDSIRVSIHAEKSPSGSYVFVLDSIINLHDIFEFDVKAENGSIKHYILKFIKPYIEHEVSISYYRDTSGIVHTLDSMKIYKEHSTCNDVFYYYNDYSNGFLNPPVSSSVYGLDCFLHSPEHTRIDNHMFKFAILYSQDLYNNGFSKNGKALLKLHDARTGMKIRYNVWDEQQWEGFMDITEQDLNLNVISGNYELTREFQNQKIVLKGYFKNLSYRRKGDT